jgi:uncharacterized protein (TIRG00374 family)
VVGDVSQATRRQRTRHCAVRVVKSPAARLAGTALGLAILIHGIDMRQALVGLREADGSWLLLGAGVTALSLASGAMGWGLLVRSHRYVSWRTLGAWYAEGVVAAQILPTGIGGDVVRGVHVSRAAGTPSALACIVGSRVAGAFAMALCGLAAAILLRPSLGSGALGAAALYAAAITVGGILALNAERVVVGLGARDGRWAHLAMRLRPFAAALSGFGRRAGLVGRIVLLGFTGWALQLCALTILARSVGVAVSWQVVAVAMPLTLVATWLPITANGVGVKEGVLVSLLVHNGVDGTHAATLALLVDLQMVPFAALGLAAWLMPAARLPRQRRRSASLTASLPVVLPARMAETPA